MAEGGLNTVSEKVQRMEEGLDTVSMTSSVYVSEGVDTISTTSSVGTLSTKVQLGPAECNTCLETALVWTRPCCLVKTCLPCLQAYVEAKISDGVIDIQCPGHSCDTHLTPGVIKRAVDTDKAKRFSFLHVKSDRCQYKKACPICDHVVTLDDTFLQYFGSLESIIACPKCLKEWCFQCMVPWHDGYSCAEYKSLKSDTGVDKWAGRKQDTGERNAQQCPKCKIWIQKIAGCYFMTCKECKTNFCYVCGVQTPHLRGSKCSAANADEARAARRPHVLVRPRRARVGCNCRTCCKSDRCQTFLWTLFYAVIGIAPTIIIIVICEFA